MAATLTPSSISDVSKAESLNLPAITLISFKLGDNVIYLLVKERNDTIYDELQKFEEKGVDITYIYLHSSIERILKEQDHNVVLSENQFKEPESTHKFIKLLLDLDTKPIPKNPWQPETIWQYKRRLGRKYNVSRLVSALVDKPEIQQSLRRINYSNFPLNSMKLANILPFLPIQDYVIFTALGSYEPSYNFSIILETFQTFVEEYQERHAKTMVLVLGGEYRYERDYQSLNDIRRNYQQLPNSIVYFKKNLTTAEKNIILKHTTGVFDYKAGTENSFNIRLGLRAGVPLLSCPESFSWQFMRNAEFGYLVYVIHDHGTSARLMHKIIIKSKAMSYRVRQYHNSYTSNMYRVLRQFEEENELFQNPE